MTLLSCTVYLGEADINKIETDVVQQQVFYVHFEILHSKSLVETAKFENKVFMHVFLPFCWKHLCQLCSDIANTTHQLFCVEEEEKEAVSAIAVLSNIPIMRFFFIFIYVCLRAA